MSQSKSPKPTFGTRLRELRKAKGKTQLQVATAIRVDFTYLSKMEKSGGLVPAAKKIDEIASFLELNEEERAELYRLAEKLPDEVRQMLVRDPEAASFYRAVNRMDDAKRRAFLRDLVEQLEREQQHDERQRDEQVQDEQHDGDPNPHFSPRCD